MKDNYGWKCPGCQRCFSPLVMECQECNQSATATQPKPKTKLQLEKFGEWVGLSWDVPYWFKIKGEDTPIIGIKKLINNEETIVSTDNRAIKEEDIEAYQPYNIKQ